MCVYLNVSFYYDVKTHHPAKVLIQLPLNSMALTLLAQRRFKHSCHVL